MIRSLSSIPVALVAATALATPVPAAAQQILPPIGGPGGGQFVVVCPPGQYLNGVDLRTGDDVDAIQAVCATALGPGEMPEGRHILGWHGGDGGGNSESLICPAVNPVVLAIDVDARGRTLVVHNIHLYCGLVTDAPQEPQSFPNAIFDGSPPPHNYFVGVASGKLQCPPGQVADGIHGRSGVWLDALGLVCVSPPKWRAPPPKPPVFDRSKAESDKTGPAVDDTGAVHDPSAACSAAAAADRAGRADASERLWALCRRSLGIAADDKRPKICVLAADARRRGSPAAANLDHSCAVLRAGQPTIKPGPGAQPPICQTAAEARARNSPVAPSLERSCIAAGGSLAPARSR